MVSDHLVKAELDSEDTCGTPQEFACVIFMNFLEDMEPLQPESLCYQLHQHCTLSQANCLPNLCVLPALILKALLRSVLWGLESLLQPSLLWTATSELVT